jgi:hypothetical protein
MATGAYAPSGHAASGKSSATDSHPDPGLVAGIVAVRERRTTSAPIEVPRLRIVLTTAPASVSAFAAVAAVATI